MVAPADQEVSGLLRRIDRVLATRHMIRLPLLFATGLVLALAAGTWITPRYLSLCRVLNRFASSCAEVPAEHIRGYSVAVFGVGMLILGPVVNTLYRLVRYGQAWETPRGPETAASNVPIAVGFIYIALGLIIAAL